ncbi:MAG: hypothetical protein ACI80L_001397, partial [Pseudohongiellaceae bacterium]
VAPVCIYLILIHTVAREKKHNKQINEEAVLRGCSYY